MQNKDLYEIAPSTSLVPIAPSSPTATAPQTLWTKTGTIELKSYTHYHAQEKRDRPILAFVNKEKTKELLKQGQQVCSDRCPRNFFADLNFNQPLSKEEVKHLNLVLEASCALRQEPFTGFTRERVKSNQVPFNLDHLEWAEEITEKQLRDDLASGKLSREIFNVLKDPTNLVRWTVEEFEDRLENNKKDRDCVSHSGNTIGTNEHLTLLAERAALDCGDVELAHEIKNRRVDVQGMREVIERYSTKEANHKSKQIKKQEKSQLNHDILSDDDGSDFDELAFIEKRVKEEFKLLDINKDDLFNFKTPLKLQDENQEQSGLLPHNTDEQIDPEKEAQREKLMREKTMRRLVENMDLNTLRAKKFNLSESDFYCIMCRLMSEKYKQIDQIRSLFEKRIEQLVGAKNYEIMCERTISIESCRKMVQKRFTDLGDLFNTESKGLWSQYKSVDHLIGFYENKLKDFQKRIGLQEIIISRLSSSLFAKNADEQGENMALDQLEKIMHDSHEYLLPNLDHPYLQEPFEFYGGNFKLSEVEKQIHAKNALFKSQEAEIRGYKQIIEQMKSETQAMFGLHERTERTCLQAQDKLNHRKRKIKRERKEYQSQIDKLNKESATLVSKYQKALAKVHDQFKTCNNHYELELQVHEQIEKKLHQNIAKLTEQLNKATHVMKTKKYTDQYQKTFKGLDKLQLVEYIESLHCELTTGRKAKVPIPNPHKLSTFDKREKSVVLQKTPSVTRGMLTSQNTLGTKDTLSNRIEHELLSHQNYEKNVNVTTPRSRQETIMNDNTQQEQYHQQAISQIECEGPWLNDGRSPQIQVNQNQNQALPEILQRSGTYQNGSLSKSPFTAINSSRSNIMLKDVHKTKLEQANRKRRQTKNQETLKDIHQFAREHNLNKVSARQIISAGVSPALMMPNEMTTSTPINNLPKLLTNVCVTPAGANQRQFHTLSNDRHNHSQHGTNKNSSIISEEDFQSALGGERVFLGKVASSNGHLQNLNSVKAGYYSVERLQGMGEIIEQGVSLEQCGSQQFLNSAGRPVKQQIVNIVQNQNHSVNPIITNPNQVKNVFESLQARSARRNAGKLQSTQIVTYNNSSITNNSQGTDAGTPQAHYVSGYQQYKNRSRKVSQLNKNKTLWNDESIQLTDSRNFMTISGEVSSPQNEYTTQVEQNNCQWLNKSVDVNPQETQNTQKTNSRENSLMMINCTPRLFDKGEAGQTQ